MATNFEKLQRLLEELFQLDQADLDFGIYRIMNQKRDEVVRFLEKDLLPQVKEAFSHYKSADKAAIQQELDKAIEQAAALGVDPESTAKVKELRAKYDGSAVDVAALENEVFSHLYNFFRRYYHEGDFISLRRYKEGVYAIPYEGEEVKLHWANHDQYYVKSSEYFRDYVFTVPSGKRVRVHLVAASTEQDNKKEAPGKERRFMICEENPIYEENGELFIRFQYGPAEGNKKQDALNKEASDWILGADGYDEWVRELSKPAPTKANPKRTVLEKHLTQYTARNTFDYFIHKDLGGFLRRELDFYIKNEVMHLDDIEHETAPRVEQYLSKIKVIRKIGHKIIQFLEQLENFQRKLWLKKKFVVETNYCITLGLIPEAYYPEIAANEAQVAEWAQLFAIDAIEEDLNGPGYSMPLSVEFLKAFPALTINTCFFSKTFVDGVLQDLHSLDDATMGVAIKGENFQAIKLIEKRLNAKIGCLYLDPPYNTSASEIIYKNSYKHSSWLSFLHDRVLASRKLLARDGIACLAIDDAELARLHLLLLSIFGEDNYLATVAVRSKPQGRAMAAGFSQNHEYAEFFANGTDSAVGRLPRDEDRLARYPERDEQGRFAWANFRGTGANSFRRDRRKLYYPVWISESTGIVTVPEMEWNESRQQYEPTESRPEGTVEILPIDENGTERTWMFGAERARKESAIEIESRKVNGEWQLYRKYRPNQSGTLPGTWWADPKYSASESGTKVLREMFRDTSLFSYPKSIHTVTDCIRCANVGSNAWVLDFFAGSGTTAHAVVDLNRQDAGSRKFAVVEMGEHFESTLLPRVRKAIFSPLWQDGRPRHSESPANGADASGLLKVLRLESYEDALNNIGIASEGKQASLLEQHNDLREQYILSYMLDVETRGSQSLLNVEQFRKPDEYMLRVERNGETQLVNVDLVETFNWLLGLTVKHIDVIRGVRVVEGTNPDGERVLVLWRNLDETDNGALDKWLLSQKYNPRDYEFELIYVNGDNNLENLRRGDQTWKVRLTEEEFGRLMFDVEDM